MPKVTISGFVEKMRKGKAKAAKARASKLRKPVARRHSAVRAKKYCVYQTHDGVDNFVCECRDASMARDLARHLNESARAGVHFHAK